MNNETTSCALDGLSKSDNIQPDQIKGIVSFYGKAGCKGNARQMEQLKEAGYVVQFVDLLSRKLEAKELLNFFAGRSIHDCVNLRAPQITAGEFKPETLSEDELLQAMIESPILIKRPLLFFRGEFACGSDHPLMARLLGDVTPVEGCQRDDDCSHHQGA
ncbi:ArsC/Spx/MgsR family protein [Coraliomargarita parva]|uniref:ArsC/Spx/MgsR family protein n=1 Tax=Coraliomargarita parva TaxID=3014050 RepID=UPI0022B4BF3E|nr:ArsC/Spx/MgsR family protein [Coraliomargarita parva]